MSDSEVGSYFIGGVPVGSTIVLPYQVRATLREQEVTSDGVARIVLVIEELLIEVRSDDTLDTCSLFSYGDTFYNIQGTGKQGIGKSKRSEGAFLQYRMGVTDPTCSPCRGHPVQRDLGMRLD